MCQYSELQYRHQLGLIRESRLIEVNALTTSRGQWHYHYSGWLYMGTLAKVWRSARPETRAMLQYAIAAGCVAASLFIREMLTYAFGMGFPAVTFYPSVLVAALLGKLAPGLFATVLSTLAVWCVVLPLVFHSFCTTGHTSLT
jgi:hypothetical protein